jgi:hypothetical protein
MVGGTQGPPLRGRGEELAAIGARLDEVRSGVGCSSAWMTCTGAELAAAWRCGSFHSGSPPCLSAG